MQINGISSIAAISSVGSNSNAPARPAGATRPSVTTASSSAAAAVTTTSQATPQTATQAANSSASGRSGGAGGGGGSAAGAASSLVAEGTAYSTTVGGKSYAGSVQEADGVYVASIPNLPGASTSGASAQQAEETLNTLISILA
jgi:hypothetical protein